jgi:hypothetical protein
MKLVGHVFSTRIRPQNLNTFRKLGLNICYKGLKNRQGLKFGLKKIDPSIPTKIHHQPPQTLPTATKDSPQPPKGLPTATKQGKLPLPSTKTAE